jgi:hypothetical protein
MVQAGSLQFGVSIAMLRVPSGNDQRFAIENGYL